MTKNIQLFLCATIFLFVYATACQATEYNLGPISLRKTVDGEIAKTYTCKSLPYFSNTQACTLSKSISASLTIPANKLIKSSDGSVLFAYARYSDDRDPDKMLDALTFELSKAFGGTKPRRFTVDEGTSGDTTLLIWGDVQFETLSSNSDEYEEIGELIEKKYGLLFSTDGDIRSTKAVSKPLYRVIGGDGLAVSITKSDAGRAIIQKFIVAAGTLSEKNFEAQAREFLAKNQKSSANDFSRWYEIAFMVRRLALNTTVQNANRVLDELFDSIHDKKYYSHVWATVPTSVMNHLQLNTYRSADIFSEKTEFPDIREQMIAQLNAAPNEPFSEFILYALGRFDEAVKINRDSPIRPILVYAKAHSTLRNILSKSFKDISKPGDIKLLASQLTRRSYRISGNPELAHDYHEEISEAEFADEDKNVMLSKKDFFNNHAYEHIADAYDEYKDGRPSLTQYLNYFNQFPERYHSRPIAYEISSFVTLTEPLLPQLEELIRHKESPHFDDAAYLLGWLAYHRGNVADALKKFEIAIAPLKSRDSQSDRYWDFSYYALHQVNRILRTLSPEEAIALVDNNAVLSSDSEVWQTVLTSLYNSYQYKDVILGAKIAFSKFGVSIESLPVTTDPERIETALTKLNLTNEYSLSDIAYLYHSSREIGALEDSMSDANKKIPLSVTTRIKSAIIKYSLTEDADLDNEQHKKNPRPIHKDLRQSIHVIKRSLDLLPKTPDFAKFREWLHYKRIRLLAQFDPVKVAEANADFQHEFPNSLLLDDGIAEQVFAEAIVIGDMVKATKTFDSLRQRYPKANAIDNAYSWVAIGWTCVGQPVRAREVDQQISRLFPLTRHARYARDRIQDPKACGDLEHLYNWDYEAMRWRERHRIGAIQESLKARHNRADP